MSDVSSGLCGALARTGASGPWLGWLAVCLCRQRARQTWLMEIARSHLSDSEADSGDVPRLPGWSFDYHGAGLCLSGPGGEILDVDFHDERGCTIDPFFFAQRVLNLSEPPLPEARLARWLPGDHVVVCGLDALRRLELIEHPESDHIFCLCSELEALHEAVAAVDFSDHDTARRWGEGLGDPAVAGGEEASVRRAHHRWLRTLLHDRRRARGVVQSVAAALPADEAVAACVALISGPIDAATGGALEALRGLPGQPFTSPAAELARLVPGEHHPYPAWAMARYFLEQGVAREAALDVAVAFASVERVQGYTSNPYVSELALLLLEHAPRRALPFVRLALRSAVPDAVGMMAAALALLDRPWCHRELEQALKEPATDRGNARYLTAALAHSQSEVARRRASGLAPPPPEHSGVGFTFDEVLAHNLDTFFGSYLNEARDVVERLRGQLLDDL